MQNSALPFAKAGFVHRSVPTLSVENVVVISPGEGDEDGTKGAYPTPEGAEKSPDVSLEVARSWPSTML